MADSVAGTAATGHAAADDVVGVVLAAGEGRRLRPLTDLRPKPLCPVGNVALLDLALDRVEAVTPAVAVNLHHGRAEIEAHLDGRAGPVHRSIEEPEALGTAGALGLLRPWIDGRAALVVNADAWTDARLGAFVDGWDGERVRLLVTPGSDGRPGFGPRVGLVASLMPWAMVAALRPEPSGLYETMWLEADRAGRLETVAHPGRFVDCGTPADYLRANLGAVEVAGGSIVARGAVVAATASIVDSVVGEGAHVAGAVVRSVVWAGAVVAEGETLTDGVRTPVG